MVFFESPHRVAATLADMVEAFGAQRSGALCRELTKTYEEVWRGTLAELYERATGEVRGEVTLVIGGAPVIAHRGTAQDWVAAVARREESGADRKEAIAAVAREAGVPRREVYDAVVAARHQAKRP
jgi:16S rRNA (cytidine1402-2'-O)-methyltransferase